MTDSSLLASYTGATPPLVIYADAIASTGAMYWAIWNDGTIPSTPAAVIAAVGAYGSGSQSVAATGPQPAIGPIAVYGESVWYLVWDDGANSSTIYSGVAFGGPAGGGGKGSLALNLTLVI